MKPYSHREPEVPHIIPPLITGAPRGASASVRCENGAVYDRFENADDVGRRWLWERRAGCGPREPWGSAEPIQATLL